MSSVATLSTLPECLDGLSAIRAYALATRYERER